MLARLRTKFPGTFTRPLAELIALGAPTPTAATSASGRASGSASTAVPALDAFTFPDADSAEANRAGRSAAVTTLNAIPYGSANSVRVSGSSVTEQVLSLNLTAAHPQDLVARVLMNGLGGEICT